MPVTSGETSAPLFGRFRGFQDLAQHRIENILLVSSLYDSFILAEDGQLGELILGEFLDLSFRHSPGITRVSSGAEALALALGQRRFNLIITSLHVGDMDAPTLARKVKDAGLGIPVVLLAYDTRELKSFLASDGTSDLDGIYLWQGDATILLAIVKQIEDRVNVARRHRADGRPGGHRHRGQRPLLLLVPAGDLLGADAPLAATRPRGRQSLAPAHAHPGAPEDPAVPDVRGGLDDVLGVPRERAGRHLRYRVPDGRTHLAGRRRGVRPTGARRAPRRARGAPVERGGEQGAGRIGRRGVPPEGIAGAPARSAQVHGGQLRLWRFCLPPARRDRGRAGRRPADARGAARDGAGREHRLSLGAQPLLEVAQGADRVRHRPPHAPAQGLRLRRLRSTPPRPASPPFAPTASSARARRSSTSTARRSTRAAGSRGSAAGRSAARPAVSPS